uniref:Uncharacterized protein n=1 Tax=Ditylenchus dipsaci TaxID=166011 RepID=A0A915DGT3_9BILA
MQMSQEAQPSEDPKELLNHCYILQLCSKASQILCKIFLQRWSHYCSLNSLDTKWVDGDDYGQQLLQLFKPPTKMRNIFKEGNTDKWDVTALCMAIEAVSKAINKLTQSDPFNNYESEDKFITVIRHTRNQIVHWLD